MEHRFAIIGGGTSGHINPALAIASILKDGYEKKGDTCKFIFAGRKAGLEGELIPAAGYEFIDIEAKPFPSRPSVKLVKAQSALVRGKKQCIGILNTFRPECVISTGGYVSAPMIVAAKRMGIPFMMHEANAFPGRANRFLSKGAALIMTGFPDRSNFFGGAKKVIFTGNPVRKIMFGNTYEDSREKLGIPEGKKFVFAMGGSLGSATITGFILSCAKRPEFKDVKFVLSCGKHNSVHITDEDRNLPNLEIKEYITDTNLYLSGSDVAILRAGAVTCAELTATGACAIMVPYPHAAHDHQTYNARSIAEKGGGVVVSDADCESGKILGTLTELLNDDEKRLKMRENASKLAIKDTDQRIFDAITGALKSQD
ncbi:MAG: undecaprenyldiphospho-muramoylpentapeptide beta-N-acetylglucosaminyltransferase [Clostridiales bacterium]|nr:undecaprenyldiphospho-muramoylpentapeptide beta-N-acetylglucosaminyltransferase [Clostridiales bacterium]